MIYDLLYVSPFVTEKAEVPAAWSVTLIPVELLQLQVRPVLFWCSSGAIGLANRQMKHEWTIFWSACFVFMKGTAFLLLSLLMMPSLIANFKFFTIKSHCSASGLLLPRVVLISCDRFETSTIIASSCVLSVDNFEPLNLYSYGCTSLTLNNMM